MLVFIMERVDIFGIGFYDSVFFCSEKFWCNLGRRLCLYYGYGECI